MPLKIIILLLGTWVLSGCGGQSPADIASGRSALKLPGGIRITGIESDIVKYERKNNENERNVRGSRYDRGVQIGSITPLGKNSSGFLAPLVKGGGSRSALSTNVFQRNHSLQNAPAFYKRSSRLSGSISKTLRANGLWYNKSTGLLSSAPYEIRLKVLDYFDERYIQDKSAAMRAVDFLINEDNRRYTKEILAQGYFRIRTSYLVELIDRSDNSVVYTKNLHTNQKISVYKDSNWEIHVGKKSSPAKILRQALQTAFDEFLPAKS